MSENTQPRFLSDRVGLSILAAVSGLLAVLLVSTYLQYVLLAIVLAYVLAPAQRRLQRYMSSGTAAVTLILLSIFALLIPIAYILTIAIRQGLELLTAVQEGQLSVDTIPDQIEILGFALELEPLYTTYQEPIEAGLQRLGTGTLSVLSGLPGVFIGLTVTIFVLFALLRDGDRLVSWLQSLLPVSDRVQRELFAELDNLMWASVLGNVAVAGIQAVLIGLGLAAVGVPGVVFLTVIAFVLTLFPLVGSFGVWVPVSVYLFVIGRPISAAALFVFGSLVSVSDLYLRPVIINRSGVLNVAIIVVGIFGGLVLFGAIGLFVGPVVLGGAKVVLDVYIRERPNSSGY